jgi:hypothetical protein
MKKEIYDNLNKENINKNLFEVDFDFTELSKTEKEILKNCILKINEEIMEFELLSIDKVIQPLDILIRLKNEKISGEVKIKMHDKDGRVLGVLIFKTLKFTEINNLIDFNFEVDGYKDTRKNITTNFTFDDILYSSDGKEFNKLT